MSPAELEVLMMAHPAEQLFDVNADLEPMSLIQRIISLFRRGS